MKKIVVLLLFALLALPCVFSTEAYVSTNYNILSYTSAKLSTNGYDLKISSFSFASGSGLNAQLGLLGDITYKSQLGGEFSFGVSSTSTETSVAGAPYSDASETVFVLDIDVVGKDKLSDKFSVLGKGGFHAEFATADSGSKIKINGYGIGVDLSGMYKLSDRLDFTFGLKWAYIFSITYEVDDVEYDIDSSNGFFVAPYIGISYSFDV